MNCARNLILTRGRGSQFKLEECLKFMMCHTHYKQVISNLDCGLDCWTGLMDSITGLTFEVNLFESLDL